MNSLADSFGVSLRSEKVDLLREAGDVGCEAEQLLPISFHKKNNASSLYFGREILAEFVELRIIPCLWIVAVVLMLRFQIVQVVKRHFRGGKYSTGKKRDSRQL